MKINVGIIGASGYAGAELVRILAAHPHVKLTAMSSVSYEGKQISEIYPNLRGIVDDVLCPQDEVTGKSDIVFASLPHGLSEPIAATCVSFGKVLIDLGADFRLRDEDEHRRWYGQDSPDPQLRSESVYGLPELNRESIRQANIIANPGCYPTSAALGLMPAMKNGLIKREGIIIDSKSGVTGAGRGLSQTTHYPEANEAFMPYKVAAHRHMPEIEQTLCDIANGPVKVTFVPHLLPINRGIVSTMYADLIGEFDSVCEAYRECYEKERFVRVMKQGESANLRNVRMSNYCDISLHHDERSGKLIVISAIDNMVKGAAGQAIQNMNIVCGFDESTGIDMIPPAF